MYFSQFFCGVDKKAYPFERRTWRRSPPGTNSVIKFLIPIACLCIFPKYFEELIKMPTHLREGPRGVVHQGRNPLSSFAFILHAYVSFLLRFSFFMVYFSL
jgi:hypothetical protein